MQNPLYSMSHEIIKQIENWNQVNKWDWDQISTSNQNIPEKDFETHFIDRKNAKTNYERALHFFNKNIEEIWDYLGLMQVITLASLFKVAAYQAYNNNFAGFRNFCLRAWNEGIIDFDELGAISIEEFATIQQMFHVKHQIFSYQMPHQFFKFLDYSNTYTFRLTEIPFSFARYPSSRAGTKNLIFKGSDIYFNNNNLIDILCHFQNAYNISFEDLYFNRFQSSILRQIKIKALKITNCVALPSVNKELVQAFIQSKYYLENIFIDNRNKHNKSSVIIEHILENIHLFKKLKSLTISLKIMPHYLKKLWKIKKNKSLKFLKLLEIKNEEEDIGIELKQEVLKNLKGNTDISIIMQLSNDKFLTTY